MHWRRGQPIGLSGDEFTPPDRRAELLRGGQFALRISALVFFSSSSCVPRVSPSFPPLLHLLVLRFPLATVRQSRPLAARSLSFPAASASADAAAGKLRERQPVRSNKGERAKKLMAQGLRGNVSLNSATQTCTSVLVLRERKSLALTNCARIGGTREKRITAPVFPL